MDFKFYITPLVFFILVYTFSTILFASGLKDDEKLVFMPTYASIKNSIISTSIHTWVFELEKDSIIRKLIISDIEKYIPDINKNKYNKNLFRKRMQYFMVDNQRGKEISINIYKKKFKLKKTLANGHSITPLSFPYKKNNKVSIIEFSAILENANKKLYKGIIQVIQPRGVSIISDIDDTIKHSNVLNKTEMIKNTFLHPFKAVPGMAKCYNKWKKKGHAFHYVSGSPWQLYFPIIKFMKKNKFPYGSFHMKYLRIKDRSILKFLNGKQKKYKINIIENIIKDFPHRKFILIGDSGEKDPEVYAAITKKYRYNILYVCIRDIDSIKYDINRYKEIEKIIGKDKFILFKTGKELLNLKI